MRIDELFDVHTFVERVYFLFAKLQQRKQASWTEYTALGFITTPHSQPHRCPDIWNVSEVDVIAQASMNRKTY